MSKKWMCGIFTGALLMLFAGSAFGLELLSEEQAMKEMFPGADKIEKEKKVYTPEELKAVKDRLGGALVHKSANSKSKDVTERNEYVLFYGVKDGKRTGVAFIEEQPGKWGVVKYVIQLDIATGKIKNMAVMSLSEKRGRPIATKNFLDQFNGKGGEIELRKNINAVSGATVSSDATCFAAKKIAILYEETVLKKKK